MLHFTKMHGIGNDYIYFNCLDGLPVPEQELPELSRRLSDRHKGVGGDGIILICPSEVADFKMRIFNADGSEAKMCGNGSRCVGKYVHDHNLTDRLQVSLETLSGLKILNLHPGSDGKIETVTVDMGPASLLARDCGVDHGGEMVSFPVKTSQGEMAITTVSVGNPHGVVFVKDLDQVDFYKVGPELENHPMWADRANIEFVQPQADGSLRVRVWERGSGETMACGTGACAVAAAARVNGLCGSEPVKVILEGGTLEIALDPETGHTIMTGPATEVFTGECE